MPKSVVKMKQYAVRVNGVLHRKSFSSAKAAREWQADMKKKQDQIRSGIKVGFQPTLLSDQIVEFLRGRTHLASYEHDKYRMGYYIMSRKSFAGKFLHDLKKQDWSPIFGKTGELVVTHKLSATTHNRIRTLVRKMYQDAMKDFDPPRAVENPIDGIKPLKEKSVEEDEMEFLETQREVAKYLDAAYKDTVLSCWGIFSMISLNTGLRIGNVAGLKWSDIDWKKRTMWVRRKYAPNQKSLIPGLKSGKLQKEMGLNSTLYAALLEWKSRSRFDAPDDYICSDEVGKWITASMIYKANIRTLKRAELPQMKPHALRHTYATQYLKAGGSIYTLKDILDHSSIRVTEKYVHAIKATIVKDAEVFTAAPTQIAPVIRLHKSRRSDLPMIYDSKTGSVSS